MIREKDIKEGSKLIGLGNSRIFEIVKIYKNYHGNDYVMLKDLSTNGEYEVPKEHLKHMQFDLYYK